MNDYGTALRNAREKRSITQTELARRSGISRREISDIERGFTASPRLITMESLAHALGLTIDELLKY